MYQKYGDVVVFDTTYKVNSYDMPFGMFVGIDNHGRTILLGCALLRNETTKTFEWLFEKFSLLMKKSPKTILTDQDPWMTRAIAKEMASTKHAFCIWHITSKFSSWFTSVLRNKYSSWCSEFYDLYKLDEIEEFEQKWPLVIAKYNLEENKHVKGLYQIKSFWVPAYLHSYFFGGMTTTGRSESINSFIKKFISSRTSQVNLSKKLILRLKMLGKNNCMILCWRNIRGSYLRSLSRLEEQGHQCLTPFAFKKFQQQFAEAMQYSVQEKNANAFIVKHHKAMRSHMVDWDGKVAKCNCKNFEFVGILCRHILSVLIHKDCFEIPSTYWLSRWSRQEDQSNEISPSLQEANIVDPSYCANSNDVPSHEIELVQCPINSKPKGRPKNGIKTGRELAKKPMHCKLCRIE